MRFFIYEFRFDNYTEINIDIDRILINKLE
jgi:hypothetical protein